MRKMDYLQAAFTVLVLVAIAFAIASAITNRFGTMPGTPVEAADDCEKYALHAVAELEARASPGVSVGQLRAARAQAWALLYIGCRGR